MVMSKRIVLDRNRSHHDIVASILAACKSPNRKTRMMYAANLNYPQLNEYLVNMVKSKLLSDTDGTFVITHKGIKYLDIYEQLLDITERTGVQGKIER